MNTQEFILACLGCYNGACLYIEQTEKAFGVELTDEDVCESVIMVAEFMRAPQSLPIQLGNDLITRLFGLINNKAQEAYLEYAEDIANEFEYFVDDYASSLKFNHEEVNNWEELCAEIEAWIGYQKAIREDKGYDW